MKTTTEPASREPEYQKPVPAAQTDSQMDSQMATDSKTDTRTDSKRPDDSLDPDFDIGVTGGPSDSGGDPNTRPIEPPRTT